MPSRAQVAITAGTAPSKHGRSVPSERACQGASGWPAAGPGVCWKAAVGVKRDRREVLGAAARPHRQTPSQ